MIEKMVPIPVEEHLYVDSMSSTSPPVPTTSSSKQELTDSVQFVRHGIFIQQNHQHSENIQSSTHRFSDTHNFGLSILTTAASAASKAYGFLQPFQPISSQESVKNEQTTSVSSFSADLTGKMKMMVVKPVAIRPTVSEHGTGNWNGPSSKSQHSNHIHLFQHQIATTVQIPVSLSHYHPQPGKPHPLALPEILSHIFSFLQSPLNTGTDPTKPLDFVKVDSIKYTIMKPRLHSCVLVNKVWNACATKLLWRNVKIGSEVGCQRLVNTLERQLKKNRQPFPVFSKTTRKTSCWGENPDRCPYHLDAIPVNSAVNGWHYGTLIKSFTLIPPHGPAGDDFNKWDVDLVVIALAVSCPNLEELNLSNCTQVTDKSLSIIAQHCQNLKRLNLNRCDLVSSEAVRHLARNCSRLEILNLSRPLIRPRTSISDDAIHALVTNSSNLAELRLRNCDMLSDKTVIEMSKTAGQNLLALDISWCGLITDNAIVMGVAPHCERLKSLALNGCKRLRDASLSSLLNSCPSIASLSLAHLPCITDTVLTSMAEKLKNLVILSLNGCNHVGDQSIIALSQHCPKLQSLSLFSLTISDEAVKSISSKCKSLVSLSISQCVNITDEGAVSIAQLPLLQSLYLNNAKITDRAILVIAHHCRYLRALSLNDCRQLTDNSIVSLSKNCIQLQSLSMNGCGITAVSVKAVVDFCVDLRELSIKECPQCVLNGPAAQVPICGNGGMQNLTAIGEDVLQRMLKRRIALML